jgi:hypothetical protein
VKFLALILIAAGISAQPGFAQAPGRKISFRTLFLTEITFKELLIPGEKPEEPVKVPVYPGDISPVVEGNFQNDQVNLLTQSGTDKDGLPTYTTVAAGPLAKSSRQLFLIYKNPAATPESPYVINAVDDDTKSYPMGMVRAFNLSPVAVRFKLAGVNSPELAAGKIAYFHHSKTVNDFNMYPAEVDFKSANGNWFPASSSAWKSTDRTRLLVITMIDPRSKSPIVRLFSDLPSWVGQTTKR